MEASGRIAGCWPPRESTLEARCLAERIQTCAASDIKVISRFTQSAWTAGGTRMFPPPSALRDPSVLWAIRSASGHRCRPSMKARADGTRRNICSRRYGIGGAYNPAFLVSWDAEYNPSGTLPVTKTRRESLPPMPGEALTWEEKRRRRRRRRR
jgi:hypothetical protein